jgi:putative SOS response-associated peptidase YedK
MCFRTKLDVDLSKIEDTFKAKFIDPQSYKPQEEINAFTFSKTPVITDDNRGEIQMFHWGLIPFWAKDDSIKKMTLNARIETIAKKPSFRNSVENRCLIIANGYYEWQWLDPKGKEKQKYLINPKNQEVFAFAGIYSNWNNPVTGEIVNSYSIVTTTANELMSEIHNNKKRMPVVLRKQDVQSWLHNEDHSNFAFPYDVELETKAVG